MKQAPERLCNKLSVYERAGRTAKICPVAFCLLRHYRPETSPLMASASEIRAMMAEALDADPHAAFTVAELDGLTWDQMIQALGAIDDTSDVVPPTGD